MPTSTEQEIATRRRRRSRLYKLLAAVHSGPLGYQLLDQIRFQIEELFAPSHLPDVLPEPPAELYRWCYGFCPGNKALGCAAGTPSSCLTAKLLKLAYSAGKGANKRRLREADYLTDDLIPCLDTLISQVPVEAYRSLLVLTKAIAHADAEQLYQQHD